MLYGLYEWSCALRLGGAWRWALGAVCGAWLVFGAASRSVLLPWVASGAWHPPVGNSATLDVFTMVAILTGIVAARWRRAWPIS